MPSPSELQQDALIALGELFGPLRRYVRQPDQYTEYERDRMLGRFFSDSPQLQRMVASLAASELGHIHQMHKHRYINAMAKLHGHITEAPEELARHLNEFYPAIRDAIATMPIAAPSSIIEAQSPFTAYVSIKALCERAVRQLVWVDRYLHANMFHRYLRDVPDDAAITLVTWPKSKQNSSGKAAFDEFIDISRLFAKERGATGYRLLTMAGFHDRWLQCDDQLFQLGGSIKDAAVSSSYSISEIEPSEGNFAKLDGVIEGASELFGPSSLKHP